MNNISSQIEAIRNDRSHGASELTRLALEIMQDTARASTAASPLEFLEDMREVARRLTTARTTMVSIRNSISRFMYELISQYAKSGANSEDLKNWSMQAAVNLIGIVAEAKIRAIYNAAAFIPNGTHLLTCSYSSTVIETLRQAAAGGKSFDITVLESKSGGHKYGEMTAARLSESKIASQVIADDKIKSYLSQANMILIGADAVLAAGSIINGCPSLTLARAAAENISPVPVYSICESTKFCTGSILPLEEDGFDLIPAHLIKGIITENTIIKPADLIKN